MTYTTTYELNYNLRFGEINSIYYADSGFLRPQRITQRNALTKTNSEVKQSMQPESLANRFLFAKDIGTSLLPYKLI